MSTLSSSGAEREAIQSKNRVVFLFFQKALYCFRSTAGFQRTILDPRIFPTLCLGTVSDNIYDIERVSQ